MMIHDIMTSWLLNFLGNVCLGIGIGGIIKERQTMKRYHFIRRLKNKKEDEELGKEVEAIATRIFEFEKKEGV
jgi:hypothetical protein